MVAESLAVVEDTTGEGYHRKIWRTRDEKVAVVVLEENETCCGC
jgi:hypothetical protein